MLDVWQDSEYSSTHCSGISVADFKQINAGRANFNQRDRTWNLIFFQMIDILCEDPITNFKT